MNEFFRIENEDNAYFESAEKTRNKLHYSNIDRKIMPCFALIVKFDQSIDQSSFHFHRLEISWISDFSK